MLDKIRGDPTVGPPGRQEGRAQISVRDHRGAPYSIGLRIADLESAT